VAELKGKRIAVGLPGSASRTTALRVLAAHGLDEGAFEALDLGPDQMLVAVQRDRADAALQVIGVPANSVRNALLEIPLRLVPLAPEAVAKLVASDEGYFAYTIARGSYATQRKDVPTIATAALLLVASDLADSEVAAVTHFTDERGRDLAALGSAQGAQVSAANARLGVSVPIRDAALRALAEIK
jgi:TRAP transporter TAXI family solute receptor